MPFKDKTGPLGEGPMTGRGMGPCGGGFGRGRGHGRGFGRGSRGWFRHPTKSEVKEDLEDYKKYLEEELEAVKAQQKELGEEEE